MLTYVRSLLVVFIFSSIQIEAKQAAVCPAPLPAQYTHVQAGKKVIGYFANWDVYKNNYQVENIETIAPDITHIIYTFMKPDVETARVQLHDPWADMGLYKEASSQVNGNFKKLLALKKRFPHIKVLFSLGGGTYSDNFLEIAKQGRLDDLAQSCVDFLDGYTYEYTHSTTGQKHSVALQYQGLFDGIDIDWEWPDRVDEQSGKAYVSFLQKLAQLLKKRKKKALLTTDLQVSPRVYNHLPLKKIAQLVDWINVMAYDFYSPNNDSVGLNAPICGTWSVYSIDGALQRMMSKGLSPEKMVLALPLYGYVFENAQGFLTQYKKESEGSKAKTYRSIAKNFIVNPLFEKKWHPRARVPSLYNRKDKIFVSYDDKRSLQEKVSYARLKRLQGVALWKLSGDDEAHSLVRHVIQSL